MFRIILALFILVPIVEIAVFIQIGDQLGLGNTLLIVIVTAVLGVHLLKQQGFKVLQNIQTSLAEGKMPAIEMACGAQLLFAGGLLLTPGFVTDIIGFLLMVPRVRLFVAERIIKAGKLNSHSFYSYNANQNGKTDQEALHPNREQGRTIEGEFEQKD